MVPTTTPNTGAQSEQQLDSGNDDDSDGMQSNQAESEEPSDPKIKGTDEDENENGLLDSSSNGSVSVGKSAGSGRGYSADYSASDQASDKSSDCAASGQKRRNIMKLALNRVDLKYSSSSEMESSSPQGESSLEDEVTEPGTISSASKVEARSSNNHGDTISVSAAVAPGLSYSNKQSHRHPSSKHHRRRSRPRPPSRDDSPDDLNALLSDNSYKELANTPMFDGTQVLPQWKGVRISHPMDPRIDFSTVGRMQAPALSALATSSACKNGDTGGTSNAFVAETSPSFDLPSIETYIQLLTVSSWSFYVLHYLK
jgi:hypothetical protein